MISPLHTRLQGRGGFARRVVSATLACPQCFDQDDYLYACKFSRGDTALVHCPCCDSEMLEVVCGVE